MDDKPETVDDPNAALELSQLWYGLTGIKTQTLINHEYTSAQLGIDLGSLLGTGRLF